MSDLSVVHITYSHFNSYLQFGPRGLQILAFPSNDFAQEMPPNETEKIKEWAKERKYTIDFFQPIHVNDMLQKPYEKSMLIVFVTEVPKSTRVRAQR